MIAKFISVAVSIRGAVMLVDEAHYRHMCRHLRQSDHLGQYIILEEPVSSLVFVGVADCLREFGPKIGFQRHIERRGQLEHSSRISQYLCGLQTRYIVEEPTAARVREHPVSLHLEQFRDHDRFIFAQRA